MKITRYHYQESDDLHFYMTQVTADNYEAWKEYAEEKSKKSLKKGLSVAQENIEIGLKAFTPSLEYYGHEGTEVYVVYAANTELSDPTIPSRPESIEMFVSSMTSKGAPFMSNTGITRAQAYEGIKHSELSMKLHGFAAKIMHMIHPDIHYMINAPVPKMLEIAVNSYANPFDKNAVYIMVKDWWPERFKKVS